MARRLHPLPGAGRVLAVVDSRKSWTFDLVVLLTLSGVARLTLFSGFVGGDDFAYAALAHEILEHGYPEVGPNVFAARPVLMLPIAAGIRVLGWTETAIVLPVFVASLWGIGCTYAIGRALSGRAAGVAAAVTLAVFPLDLVYATTTTNDILGSAVIATAVLLSLHSFSSAMRGRAFRAGVLAVAGGILAGLAPGVKLSMLMGLLPFALLVPLIVAIERSVWRAALFLLAGFLAGHLLLLVFFWRTSDSMLANYAVELGFNRTFMAQPYLEARVDALWAYPRWVFGVRPATGDVDRFFPYGLFFPLATLSIVAVLRRSPRPVWLVVAWFLIVALAVEFWPLQIVPYIPIHRLPRFLHLAAIPGALLIGIAVAAVMSRRGSIRLVVAAVWVYYLLQGIDSSITAATRHHDSMLDLRFGAEMSSRFPGAVITDAEMRGYLLFRRGFREPNQMQKVLGAQVIVPRHSLVMFGGGRRIDMDPDWTERRVPDKVPPDWVKLADMPGKPRPWRRSQGAVYVSVSAASLTSKGFQHAMGPAACGDDGPWRLVDVVDIGDVASEADHDYRIEHPTFFGERMMYSRENGELEENGRAFRKSQTFEVRGLTPGEPVCIVKRVDPGARHQVSRWLAGDTVVGTVSADREDLSKWLEVAVHVDREIVTQSTLRMTEEVVSAAVDVNAYRVEVYQARRTGAGRDVAGD